MTWWYWWHLTPCNRQVPTWGTRVAEPFVRDSPYILVPAMWAYEDRFNSPFSFRPHVWVLHS